MPNEGSGVAEIRRTLPATGRGSSGLVIETSPTTDCAGQPVGSNVPSDFAVLAGHWSASVPSAGMFGLRLDGCTTFARRIDPLLAGTFTSATRPENDPAA